MMRAHWPPSQFAKRMMRDPIKIEQYFEEIKDIAPESIIYIDETGIDTFIYREYAYAKRGARAIGRIPGKKYKRAGIVATKTTHGIISPLQYEGTILYPL